MTPKQKATWIGKCIAIGLGALILSVALPVQSQGASFPLAARVFTYGLVLFTFLGVYELAGYACGLAVARLLLRESAQIDQPPGSSTSLTFRLGPATAFLGARHLPGSAGFSVCNRRHSGWCRRCSVGIVPGSRFPHATVLGGAVVIALTTRVTPNVIRKPGALEIGLVPVPPATMAKSAIAAAVFAVFVVYVGPRSCLSRPTSITDL